MAVRESLSQIGILAKVKHFLSINDLQKVAFISTYTGITQTSFYLDRLQLLLNSAARKALTRIHESTNTLLLFLPPFTGYRSTAKVISKPSY